jgi:glycosyltransferase involved in cell wall biosynthesis
MFLSAFARAFPLGVEQAVVVGEALFEADLRYAETLGRLVETLGITSRVEFRGFVEDVSRELARLDILVHASVLPEPFGQVVLEAMAAGLPVVAANAGGPAEVVTDEVNGLLYPTGDERALANALRRLAGDPALRDQLGQAGRARALDFSPSRIGPEVVNVYRRVLGLAPNDRLVGR